jgi:hypothetical protein
MLALACAAAALAATCGNLTYDLADGALTIAGTGEVTAECAAPFRANVTGLLVIADGVTGIGRAAFAEWPSLGAVSLPPSLTVIAREAFRSASLASVAFGSALRLIGSEAFGNATFASAVVRLPASATIFADSFIFASGVVRYEADPAHAKYASDAAGCLYNKTFGIIYQYPLASAAAEFALPASVAFLAHDGVFANARNLRRIDMAASGVTTLQELTFYGTPNLAAVELPRGLRAIRPFAFLYSGVNTLTIPPNVSWIEAGTFAGSGALREIAVDAASEHFASAGGVLLDANASTVYCAPPARAYGVLRLPETVREIADSALQAVRAEGIFLPDSVRVLGDSALGRYVSELMPEVSGARARWISIGGGIEEVGEDAFAGAEFGRVHWRGRAAPGPEFCRELAKASAFRATVPLESRVTEVCGVAADREADPAEGAEL